MMPRVIETGFSMVLWALHKYSYTGQRSGALFKDYSNDGDDDITKHYACDESGNRITKLQTGIESHCTL